MTLCSTARFLLNILLALKRSLMLAHQQRWGQVERLNVQMDRDFVCVDTFHWSGVAR